MEEFRKTAPEIKEMTAFAPPPVRRRRLDSGVEMIIYGKCDEPVNYLSYVTPGGECEMPSPAVAALSAIMCREGTESFSGHEINSILDFNGSWLKSNNSSHYHTLSMHSLNSCFGRVLPVFRDMALNPVFPEEALAVRREGLARNIEVSMTDVDFLAVCESDRKSKGADHPGARVDKPDDIRKITSEDLRASFLKARVPGRSTLFLCGDITPEIEDMVAEAFGELPPDSPDGKPNVIPYTPEPPLTERKISVPDALQSAVVMTLPAIDRRHPDYIPLHIAVSALGGYFGSRLMLEIRERLGLTYGISASLLGEADGAFIQIRADTDNNNVDSLIAEVRNQLELMSAQPPSGDELMRLRQTLLSSQLSVLDTPFSMMDYYMAALTSDIPDGYFERKLRAISNLTPQDIAEVSSRYFRPSQLRIAVAGK